MTFAGAASGAQTLLLCPTTAPEANSAAAAAPIRTEIRTLLAKAAREKVAAAPPGEGGSDIWGAWAAYAAAPKLAGDRTAIMLTDGQQTFKSRPPLDLAGARAEMWNIGRLRDGGSVPSVTAAKWTKVWEKFLRDHGASKIEVSSGEYIQGAAR
jgi:hypothetical protein